MQITIEGPSTNTSRVCEPILRALPGWFGIESALAEYIEKIDTLPSFLARQEDKVVGFLSLLQHNPFSAEIYVMGVQPDLHHQGVGRALVLQAEAWLRESRVEYLQVKTLGPSHPDAGYAATRAFYTGMGFRPLEEMKQIWDEFNPCLVMVKKIADRS